MIRCSLCAIRCFVVDCCSLLGRCRLVVAFCLLWFVGCSSLLFVC